jgi:carbon storage regulator
MLYLSRKIGESIVIDGRVEITVVEVRGRKVKLGCRFPPEVSVLRRELIERDEGRTVPATGQNLPPSDPETA